MCNVHLIRQALKKIPKKKQKEVADKIKEALVETQFQNPVMKISITPLHKIYNYILI